MYSFVAAKVKSSCHCKKHVCNCVNAHFEETTLCRCRSRIVAGTAHDKTQREETTEVGVTAAGVVQLYVQT